MTLHANRASSVSKTAAEVNGMERKNKLHTLMLGAGTKALGLSYRAFIQNMSTGFDTFNEIYFS